MVSILEKQKIADKVEQTFDDIISEIENDRHYPSVREAGSSPTDRAIELSHEALGALMDELLQYGLKYKELLAKPTIEEIINEINLNQEENIAEKIDGLKEIETFVRDNGERKYRYVNTVYEHTASKRYICVEEQRGVGDWEDMTSSVKATEVTKKEKISYEWS